MVSVLSVKFKNLFSRATIFIKTIREKKSILNCAWIVERGIEEKIFAVCLSFYLVCDLPLDYALWTPNDVKF